MKPLCIIGIVKYFSTTRRKGYRPEEKSTEESTDSVNGMGKAKRTTD